MLNRELDGKIAKDIFGWVYVHIGKDYDGENECEILWKCDKIDQDICNTLPFRGKIHEAYLTPRYSDDLYRALFLAKYVKLDIEVKDLPLDAEKIAQLSYDHFIKQEEKKKRIDDIIIVLKENYPKIDFINAMRERYIGILIPQDYTIVAFKVYKKDIINLNSLVYDNIFTKLVEKGEEIPLFFSTREKRKVIK